MMQYQFTVGSTPKTVTGTVGWNPNWSLGSLTIADQFDSLNTQSCAYAADDLARLASVNCGPTSPNGTIWNQTFSYDAFGNISKSGSATFLPTYTGSPSNTTPTNQFYQLPGGPTGASNYYDLDGNLTTDLTNTYSWDSDGNLIGVNTGGSSPVSITYDAMDMAIEQDSSGTYAEILNSPVGKLGLMSEQTATNLFIPLPGGEQATYTNSTIRFRHYDWLGNARFESNMNEKDYGDAAYAPFGETYAVQSGYTPYFSFTGQQQDTISGTYDFLYRRYNSSQGRWISPDPAGMTAASADSPQSWNRYAYVLNNPLRYTDPKGLWCWYGDTDDNGLPLPLLGLTWTDNSGGWTQPDNGFDGGDSDLAMQNSQLVDSYSNQNECSGNGGTWYDDGDTWVYGGGGAGIAYFPSNNGWTWALNFSKSFFGGFRIDTSPGSCLDTATNSYKPVANAFKKTRDFTKDYIAPIVASLPGMSASIANSVYSTVRYGADRGNAAEISGAIAATGTYLGAQGQAAVSAVASAARNPVVAWSVADAALLWGVGNEAVAAYQGKCH
jgi:RHS repeat-associated protein